MSRKVWAPAVGLLLAAVGLAFGALTESFWFAAVGVGVALALGRLAAYGTELPLSGLLPVGLSALLSPPVALFLGFGMAIQSDPDERLVGSLSVYALLAGTVQLALWMADAVVAALLLPEGRKLAPVLAGMYAGQFVGGGLLVGAWAAGGGWSFSALLPVAVVLCAALTALGWAGTRR